jgi:hypothetical protein
MLELRDYELNPRRVPSLMRVIVEDQVAEVVDLTEDRECECIDLNISDVKMLGADKKICAKSEYYISNWPSTKKEDERPMFMSVKQEKNAASNGIKSEPLSQSDINMFMSLKQEKNATSNCIKSEPLHNLIPMTHYHLLDTWSQTPS